MIEIFFYQNIVNKISSDDLKYQMADAVIKEFSEIGLFTLTIVPGSAKDEQCRPKYSLVAYFFQNSLVQRFFHDTKNRN